MEDFKVIDNYLMIRLPDEIDHHISVDISTRADRYIMTKKVGNVVFDFERTTFMDSSGQIQEDRLFWRQGLCHQCRQSDTAHPAAVRAAEYRGDHFELDKPHGETADKGSGDLKGFRASQDLRKG